MKIQSLLIAAVVVAAGVSAADMPEIRGIGKFRTEFRGDNQNSLTRFHGDSPEAAMRLASKRLADLGGFGTLRALPGADTVLELPGVGFWRLGVAGNTFIESFSRTRAGLDRSPLNPVRPQAYPRFLDCFDNCGPALWTGGGGQKYQLPENFEYLAKMGLANCSAYPGDCRLVAPGVFDSSIFEWMEKMSETYKVPFRQLSFNYPVSSFPLARRDNPLPYIRAVDDYRSSPISGYVSDNLTGGNSPDPVLEKLEWDSRIRAAKLLNASPWLLGWHGGVELSLLGLYISEQVAGTPYYRKFYREYLRDTLKLSLAEVGKRYYGNPGKFKSWDEVEIIRMPYFVDFDPKTSLNLRDGAWELQPDPAGKGPRPDKWIPGDPHDPLILLYRKHRGKEHWNFWARRKITIPAGKTAMYRYCHLAGAQWGGLGQKAYDLTVNGKKITMTRIPGIQMFTADLKGALRDGKNEILFNLIGQPFAGFAILNGTELKPYPEMGARKNQAFFDAIDFSMRIRVKKVEDNLIAIRSVDPLRPIKMMVMSNFYDEGLRLSEQYGAYNHETGAGGGFWAPMWGHRYASTRGIAHSSEPGGPPGTVARLRQFIGFYLMYGNSCADMVFGAQHFHGDPQLKQWLDDNRALVHCIGKYVLPRQEIGILRGTQMMRLGFGDVMNWDPGRGLLPGIGRNFSYLELPDMRNPKLRNEFKIVIDCATAVMDDSTVRAVADFVRDGGVFIAMFNTARHTPSRRDAWPLAAHFGLTVRDKTPRNGNNIHTWPVAPITFGKTQTLLPSLRGKTIEGSGVAIDSLGKAHTGAVALSGNAEPVARWDDGSLAVARIVYGKGQIVFLGTPFFYRSKDDHGVWVGQDGRNALLDEMLTGLGSRRDAISGEKSVWSQIWESKNGVYQLYLNGRIATGNNPPAEVRTAPKIVRSDRIDTVTELSSNTKTVYPVSWRNGEIQLPEQSYAVKQVRIFGAPHPELGKSALRWAKIQSKIYHPIPAIAPELFPRERPAPEHLLPLVEDWRHTAWTGTPFEAVGFDDSGWKRSKAGSFAVMGYPENARVAMRRTVKIPKHWQGRRIQLIFDAHITGWGLVPWAKVWINGKPAPFKQPLVNVGHPGFSCDVTDAAKSGKIVLAVLIDGGIHPAAQSGKQSSPHGVTGIFLLDSQPKPVKTDELTNWKACTSYGEGRTVKPGARVPALYFETSFELPTRPDGMKLRLEIPPNIRWIYLNDQAFQTPAIWSRETDISNLARWGGTNRLRLIYSLKPPIWNRIEKNPCPSGRLLWYRVEANHQEK